MQGSARKDVVFGAAGVYPVTVPGPKWKSWLKELLGGGVKVFDPYDTDALTQSMDLVLGDDELSRRMSQAALRAAQKLSWNQAAADLIAGMEEITAEPRLHYEPSA